MGYNTIYIIYLECSRYLTVPHNNQKNGGVFHLKLPPSFLSFWKQVDFRLERLQKIHLYTYLGISSPNDLFPVVEEQ